MNRWGRLEWRLLKRNRVRPRQLRQVDLEGRDGVRATAQINKDWRKSQTMTASEKRVSDPSASDECSRIEALLICNFNRVQIMKMTRGFNLLGCRQRNQNQVRKWNLYQRSLIQMWKMPRQHNQHRGEGDRQRNELEKLQLWRPRRGKHLSFRQSNQRKVPRNRELPNHQLDTNKRHVHLDPAISKRNNLHIREGNPDGHPSRELQI